MCSGSYLAFFLSALHKCLGMRQKREVRANLPGAVVPPQNPQHHQTTFGGIMPVMVWLWYRYGGGTAVLDVTFRANPSLSVLQGVAPPDPRPFPHLPPVTRTTRNWFRLGPDYSYTTGIWRQNPVTNRCAQLGEIYFCISDHCKVNNKKRSGMVYWKVNLNFN